MIDLFVMLILGLSLQLLYVLPVFINLALQNIVIVAFSHISAFSFVLFPFGCLDFHKQIRIVS